MIATTSGLDLCAFRQLAGRALWGRARKSGQCCRAINTAPSVSDSGAKGAAAALLRHLRRRRQVQQLRHRAVDGNKKGATSELMLSK
jgi:hypothetical protein